MSKNYNSEKHILSPIEKQSVRKMLALREGSIEKDDINRALKKLDASRNKDRIPIEQFAISAAVRNSRKAAKKALREYATLPDEYKITESPECWPIMNTGVPEIDNAYLSAMSVLMYEIAKANEKTSPEAYTWERYEWLKQEMPKTMDILRTSYSAYIGAYEQACRTDSPYLAVTNAILQVNGLSSEAMMDTIFPSLDVADASCVLLLISKLMARGGDLDAIDFLVERIVASNYDRFGEICGGRLISEVYDEISKSREADKFLKQDGIKAAVGNIIKSAGGVARSGDYMVKNGIIPYPYVAACSAIMRDLGFDINLRTALMQMPLSYEDILRTSEWGTVIMGLNEVVYPDIDPIPFEIGGVLYYLLKTIKHSFDEQLDAIDITDEAEVAAEVIDNEEPDRKDREIAALRSRIAALEADCKNLRSLNAAAGKRYEDLLRKTEATEEERKETLELKKEVAELRSLVYEICNQTEDEKKEAEEAEEITYPYSAPVGVIVVGGHDNWCANMRNRFPDVRFLGNAHNTDPIIFKKAACIVLQCSYIAHPVFYKALDVAREKGIPVHYLSGHSLVRCSKDLVKIITDMGRAKELRGRRRK